MSARHPHGNVRQRLAEQRLHAQQDTSTLRGDQWHVADHRRAYRREPCSDCSRWSSRRSPFRLASTACPPAIAAAAASCVRRGRLHLAPALRSVADQHPANASFWMSSGRVRLHARPRGLRAAPRHAVQSERCVAQCACVSACAGRSAAARCQGASASSRRSGPTRAAPNPNRLPVRRGVAATRIDSARTLPRTACAGEQGAQHGAYMHIVRVGGDDSAITFQRFIDKFEQEQDVTEIGVQFGGFGTHGDGVSVGFRDLLGFPEARSAFPGGCNAGTSGCTASP